MNGGEREREREREREEGSTVWRREKEIALCGFNCWLLHVKQTLK